MLLQFIRPTIAAAAGRSQRQFPIAQCSNRSSSSCAASLTQPLHPDRPIGYVSLVNQQVPYDTGLAIQSHLVHRRHTINRLGSNTTGDPEDIVVFLQHPHTYTAGRRIRGKTELEEEKHLRRLGAEYYETMRGGQITYHGPGQLIAYPILDIRDYQINVRCYVSRLEKTIIDCCSQFGIKATTTENTGVWIGEDQKIAALGVHLQRYVSSHGVALNCNSDLDWYNHIVPCGLADKKATSISEQLGRDVTIAETLPALVTSFQRLFQAPMQPIDPNGPLTSEIKSIIENRKK